MKNNFVIVYCGQKGMAATPEDAKRIIETFHGYGRPFNPTLIVNTQTSAKIDLIYADANAQRHDLRTTNCGAKGIDFYPSLADTLEEHERIYQERCEAEKRERLAKAEALKQQMLQEWNELRRGWYSVSVEVSAHRIDGNMARRWFTFSGHIIADSKMDAYNKALDPSKNGPEDMCCERSLIYEGCSAWNSSNTEVLFLGMKTDYGYSVDAWEGAKKNGEI